MAWGADRLAWSRQYATAENIDHGWPDHHNKEGGKNAEDQGNHQLDWKLLGPFFDSQ